MAKLYFYYSAMNAGKTTTLLQSALQLPRARHAHVLVVRPRWTIAPARPAWVASRIGLDREGAVRRAETTCSGGWKRTSRHKARSIACFVDEAQFLSKAQVWQLSEVVDQLNIPVLCYGLRTDFRGELFEGSRLLASADELIEIKTICHSGRKATMVVRLGPDGKVRHGRASRWRSARTSMSRSAAATGKKRWAAPRRTISSASSSPDHLVFGAIPKG